MKTSYSTEHLLITTTLYRDQTKRRNGVVLIWDGKIYGWRDALRDAYTERPGAIAIDHNNHLFRAEGGNYQDGAKAWVVFNGQTVEFIDNE